MYNEVVNTLLITQTHASYRVVTQLVLQSST